MTPDNSQPLKPEEIKPVHNITEIATIFTQCLANTLQERASINSKSLVESNWPLSGIKNNPRILTNGFVPHLGYHGLAMFPALLIRERIKKDTPNFLVSLATTTIESTVGIPLEVRGLEKVLKDNLGVDISQRRLEIASRVFCPFYVRNYLAWMVFNDPSENMAKRAAMGGVAGLASSIPDTIGNFVMKYGPELSISESYIKAAKETASLSYGNLGKSLALRSASGAVSALIFSPKAQKMLIEIFDPLVQTADQQINEFVNNSLSKKPATQAQKPSAQLMIKEGKEKEGRG